MREHEGTKSTKDTKARALVVSQFVLGAAIEVHRELGPGLLESVYELALCRELWIRQLRVERQVPVSIKYKGADLDTHVCIDLLVESAVVVELKAVERLAPIHHAQVLTYLRLAGYPVGLLLNFNVRLLRHGMRRILNG
jgi:GxxExxY protein